MKPVAIVRLDDRNRLTVPRRVREKLGIGPGSTLLVLVDEESRRMVLVPAEGIEEKTVPVRASSRQEPRP